MMHKHLLSEDLEYFLALKPVLLRAHKEQYALIKDQALHGTYATFAEAHKSAVEKFGNVPFLIMKVTEHAPPNLSGF
jgi:hypothetical protein